MLPTNLASDVAAYTRALELYRDLGDRLGVAATPVQATRHSIDPNGRGVSFPFSSELSVR